VHFQKEKRQCFHFVYCFPFYFIFVWPREFLPWKLIYWWDNHGLRWEKKKAALCQCVQEDQVRERRTGKNKYKKTKYEKGQVQERPSTRRKSYGKEKVGKVWEKPCTGKSSDKKTKQALGRPKVRALGGTKFWNEEVLERPSSEFYRVRALGFGETDRYLGKLRSGKAKLVSSLTN